MLLAGLAGCGPQPGQAEPEECAPVPTDLSPEASAGGLAGEYRLRLVSTSGEKQGTSVEGRLQLLPHEAASRYREIPGRGPDSTTTYPFYGAAELDLAAVGAVQAGSATTLDPARPGVVVIERSPGAASSPSTRILLRLGSEANRRDVLRYDGGYTVLRVRRISDGGFAGEWESGAPLPRSGGHFCAVRVDPEGR